MEFSERTIRVVIDDARCAACETRACVEACAAYARGTLQWGDGHPVVPADSAELKRLGTECLACEHACRVRGNGALTIEVPIPRLDEYRPAAARGAA